MLYYIVFTRSRYKDHFFYFRNIITCAVMFYEMYIPSNLKRFSMFILELSNKSNIKKSRQEKEMKPKEIPTWDVEIQQ